MRKIIQISAISYEQIDINHIGHSYNVLFALCDDNTLWFLSKPSGGGIADWIRMDDIPQPEDEDKAF